LVVVLSIANSPAIVSSLMLISRSSNLGFLKLQDTRHKKWVTLLELSPYKLQGTHGVLRRTLDAITASLALAWLCVQWEGQMNCILEGGGGCSGVSDYCLPPAWTNRLDHRGQQCCCTSEQRPMIGDWCNHPSTDDSTQESSVRCKGCASSGLALRTRSVRNCAHDKMSQLSAAPGL
jgi:hypothetical protein